MKRCLKCGEYVNEHVYFCPQCSNNSFSSVSNTAPSTYLAPPEDTVPPKNPAPPKYSVPPENTSSSRFIPSSKYAASSKKPKDKLSTVIDIILTALIVFLPSSVGLGVKNHRSTPTGTLPISRTQTQKSRDYSSNYTEPTKPVLSIREFWRQTCEGSVQDGVYKNYWLECQFDTQQFPAESEQARDWFTTQTRKVVFAGKNDKTNEMFVLAFDEISYDDKRDETAYLDSLMPQIAKRSNNKLRIDVKYTVPIAGSDYLAVDAQTVGDDGPVQSFFVQKRDSYFVLFAVTDNSKQGIRQKLNLVHRLDE